MMQVKNAERIARTCIRHPRGENIPMKALYNDGSVAELPQDEVTHVIRQFAAHQRRRPSSVSILRPTLPTVPRPTTGFGHMTSTCPRASGISEDDFPAIEAEMKKTSRRTPSSPCTRSPAPRPSPLWRSAASSGKVEHIGDLDDDARITFYQQGDYIDMCVGPHICYTKALKAFKLTGVSGAY